MAQFWLMDSQRRRIGPLDLATISELAGAGRISAMTRASRDGVTWTSVSQLPELARALAPPSLVEQWAREREQAMMILLLLDQAREKPTHELFGVPREASLKEYRRGFLALARKYHPARLPKSAHLELIKASMEMFQLLSQRMVLAERELAPVAPGAAEPQAPSDYSLESFVGLTRSNDGKVAAEIAMNPHMACIFTSHALVNLSTPGVFLPTTRRVPLGTQLELTFHFGDPPRDIRVAGTVVVDQPPEQKPQAGFGVRFRGLSEADRQFLKAFVGSAQVGAR